MSLSVWLVLLAVAVAGIAMLVWAFQVMFDDLDASTWGPPLVAVGGFMLVLMPMIFAGFEVGRVVRLHRAESIWPGSFVIPFVITMQLPNQVDRAAAALGQRLYMPGRGFGLLVGDAGGVRVLSGWGFATDLMIPQASLRTVELGSIPFPFGSAMSVDVVLHTPGEERISFMPVRTSRPFSGKERPEIIGQYVEGLSKVLELRATPA